MEYILIIIGVSLILIFLFQIFIFWNSKKDTTKTDVGKLIHENEIRELQLQTKIDYLSTQIDKNNSNLGQTLYNSITTLDKNIEERLTNTNKNSQDTFRNISERLTKIDETQKNIELIGVDVKSLQRVLTDKKVRGSFGESQLEALLKNIMGENSPLYSLQYKLESGVIVDAMIHAQEPLSNVPIDSKFPLENYNKVIDENISSSDREKYIKEFRQDVRKHIGDISKKYVEGKGSFEFGVLFLPAEGIFSYIQEEMPDIFYDAFNKNVWIASPSTMIVILSMLMMSIKNLEISKNSQVIKEELMSLSIEFERFDKRVSKLYQHIDMLDRDREDVEITSKKIVNKFNDIKETKVFEE